MLKTQDMFWYWKEEIPPLVCNAIVDRGLELAAEVASVGDEEVGVVDENVRKSRVSWFDINQDAWIYHILWGYMEKANKNSGWKFKVTGQQQPQFTVYDESFFYDFHEDASYHEKDMRKISLVVFLSDTKDYDGGAFEFKEEAQIPVEKGSILVFPSFLYHRVTPVTRGLRYSLVNWFTGPALV